MANDIYFGKYTRFETVSKNDASLLLGADCLVGDIFTIEFISEEGKRLAWLKNRFGATLGFFNEEISRELSLSEARGWKLQALLSFVAYSELPEPGVYWGEVALMCFDIRYEEAFGVFTERVAERLMDGIRLDVDLGDSGVKQVIDSNGQWKPKKLIPLPTKKGGTALVKTKRSSSEKMIEQGRKGNKGCYILSWVFLLALVVLLIFGLKACGIF